LRCSHLNRALCALEVKMKKYSAFFVLTSLFVAVPIISWLNRFYNSDISSNSGKWADFGSFMGGTISPILAFVSFVAVLFTIKQQKDKNDLEKELIDSQGYCANAIKCLERAYAFLSHDDSVTVPVKDRLVWLTTARLILQSKKLASAISPKAVSSLALYESEREFWSHRFYKLIDYTGIESFSRDKDYFAKASQIIGEEIEERSIKVIYDFALSFDGEKDPINDVVEYSRDELTKFNSSQKGLKEYLEQKIAKRERRT
ncbi:hypothetical protein, partial [Vibrio parahaemolyticus]